MWVSKKPCSQQRTEKAGVWAASRVSALGLAGTAGLYTTGEELWCVMGDMELNQDVLAELFP